MGRENDLRRLKSKTAVCRQNDALSRHRRHWLMERWFDLRLNLANWGPR